MNYINDTSSSNINGTNNSRNNSFNSSFNSSPSKVGFALKGKTRFQPRQNIFRSTPEVHRAQQIAQTIKDSYEPEEIPSFQPGRGRGARKAMYKPGDDEDSKVPGIVETRRGRAKNKDEDGDDSCIGNISFDSEEKKEDRASRFKKENAFSVSDTISTMMETATKRGGEDVHFSDLHMVGTMTSLEKPYLRLTCAPSPDQVRPESVLVKSLSHIMNKWKTEQNYAFVCEQLKSIRQDLTIQNIKNGFAVKVYECHARIALEKLDTTEYNQCQTRLIDLYKENKSDAGHPLEFLCYRILYYIYIKNNSDAMKIVAQLTPQQKASEDVKFGVQVFNAWTTGNYRKFFKLYLDAPKMGGYLMDSYVQRERNEAMKKLVKAYKPSVSVDKIALLLGYPDSETASVYLDDLGVQYTNASKSAVDCKKSVLDI